MTKIPFSVGTPAGTRAPLEDAATACPSERGVPPVRNAGAATDDENHDAFYASLIEQWMDNQWPGPDPGATGAAESKRAISGQATYESKKHIGEASDRAVPAPRKIPMSQSEAATLLQAAWRGAASRMRTASMAQSCTPYLSRTHYMLATRGYLPADTRPHSSAVQFLDVEYGVYHAASQIGPRTPAFLRSFQRPQHLQAMLRVFNLDPGATKGVVYNPSAFGYHDMRANNAWLLGLGHHKKSALLTTLLDDDTIVRRSAKYRAPELRTPSRHCSALARELVGMVQNDHFRAQDPILFDDALRQLLVPTAAAAAAKLEDYRTPRGMSQAFIKEKLMQANIDVSGLSITANGDTPLPKER